MLQNASFLAIVAVDTDENEPLKILRFERLVAEKVSRNRIGIEVFSTDTRFKVFAKFES